MLRINKSSTYKVIDNKIIIEDKSNQISITYSQKIFDFLEFIYQKIYFDKQIINTFSINISLIELLKKYNFIVLVDNSNSWVEALNLQHFYHNPSPFNLHISQNQLKKIYHESLNWFPFLNNEKWSKFSPGENNNKKLTNKRITTVKVEWSKRYEVDWKNINPSKIERVFEIVESVFAQWENKKYLYGSWGWFYSNFPLVLHQTWKLYLFDHHNNERFYYKNEINVEKFINENLIECDNNFKEYSSIIILVSNYKWVTSKYWNRWVKYIHLEAWAIGWIFRLICSINSTWYLELQWYYDIKLADFFDREEIFTKQKNIIYNHIICLS